MAFRATLKSAFAVTGLGTVVLVDIVDGVVRVGDRVAVPTLAGQRVELRVLGVDFADIGIGTPRFRSETALTFAGAQLAPAEVKVGELIEGVG